MFQLRQIADIAFFVTQNRHFRASEWTEEGYQICYDDREFARNWRSPRGLNV
jgi:hypothetical protein